jgi:hypothetical protein
MCQLGLESFFFPSLYKRSETKILVLLQDTFCEFIYSIHQALFHVPVVPSGWVRVISREGGFLFKPDSLRAAQLSKPVIAFQTSFKHPFCWG